MSAHHDVVTKFGTGRKTLASYIIGLGLSLLFTIGAFLVVGKHLFNNVQIASLFLAGLAVLQLIAQVVCFLRLTMDKEGRWNSLAFIFVLFIILVLVVGSLWIMYNLNYNMVH